jgi:hypothetical protein
VSNRSRTAALVIALTGAALLITVAVLGPQGEHALIDTTGWRLGTINTTNVSATTNSAAEVRVTRGYQVGPVRFFTSWVKPEPQPLGTNQLHVGDMLFDPTTKRELWTVLATERKHEFDDDTDRDGVLVRSRTNGGESWMPREKLGKVLVGR